MQINLLLLYVEFVDASVDFVLFQSMNLSYGVPFEPGSVISGSHGVDFMTAADGEFLHEVRKFFPYGVLL